MGRIGGASVLEPLPVLTENQSRCLTYIHRYFVEHRDYPTHREIAAEMDLKSTNAVSYIEPLIKKGYLLRYGLGKRNIRLTASALEKLEMMGEVAST